MKHFYIVFVIFATAVISFSSGEEVHAEENSDKSVTSSYSYSIEYSDAGNHGNYGHKIEVKNGNAKVNVHSQYPQIEEQIISAPNQHKIQKQPNPKHVKHQVLAYAPPQESVQHQKGQHLQVQHKPVQHVQSQKEQPRGKLPIETLDKHQLAVLLAQNKNPFFALTDEKDVTQTQHQTSGVTKHSSPQIQPSVSYYKPQSHNSNSIQYQTPAQPSKNSAYTEPKIQYTYQYQPTPTKNNLVYDSKVQYVPSQQYYYPETSQVNTNQEYQNYYQHQASVSAHSPAVSQQQVQYNVPFVQYEQQQHQQQQQQPLQSHQPKQVQQVNQQYVYLPESAGQTSGSYPAAPQTSLTNLLKSGQNGGPVQFLPSQQQSQNSQSYPSSQFINIPKGSPELNAYPQSLFSNVQYGTSIYGSSVGYGQSADYGSSLGYGSQGNVGYKPVETTQAAKMNQYGFIAPQGANYGAELQNGLHKQAPSVAPVQDTKSSNFYPTASNLPQENHGFSGNFENLGHLYNFVTPQGASSNVAGKQTTNAAPSSQNLNHFDYSQLGQNFFQNQQQIQYPTHYANELTKHHPQANYIPRNPSNANSNLQQATSKPVNDAGTVRVKVQKSANFEANVPQYYYPNPNEGHAENSVRYVYVPVNSATPHSEYTKGYVQ